MIHFLDALGVNFAMSDVITAMRRIATEENPGRRYVRPDRDYRACSYVDSDDLPGVGCLVGRAVISLGVPEESIGRWERDEQRDGSHDTASGALLAWLRVLGTAREEGWIRGTQQAQDDGNPWSECIDMADRDWPLNA